MGAVQEGGAQSLETAAMNANDLLLWLSAKGSGNWTRYRAAVEELSLADCADDDGEALSDEASDNAGLPMYHRLRFNIERLGHAEFFRKEFPNGWRVVPPTLACRRTDSGAVGILCGARTTQLIVHLCKVCNDVRIETTGQNECPDLIQVIADSQDKLRDLARSAGLQFQPDAARMLLAAIPPVDDPQLRAAAELPFGEDWDVHQFSTTTFGWTSVTPQECRSAAFGLFRYVVQFQSQHFLVLNGVAFRIPGQVGKYLVLKKKRRKVVSHDAGAQILSAPVSCRPPLLVDRALTLCSGLLPSITYGRLEYRNISKDIALTARALLQQ